MYLKFKDGKAPWTAVQEFRTKTGCTSKQSVDICDTIETKGYISLDEIRDVISPYVTLDLLKDAEHFEIVSDMTNDDILSDLRKLAYRSLDEEREDLAEDLLTVFNRYSNKT